MAAPELKFTVTGRGVSLAPGFDAVDVTFSAGAPYLKFECRATKFGEDYGVGIGTLVASFPATPAGVERTFSVGARHLIHGDGEYRISLFIEGEDGAWNDGVAFIPAASTGLITAGGEKYYCTRERGE